MCDVYETKPFAGKQRQMADIYEEIMRLRARGEGAVLATVISTQGSVPREQGAKLLSRQDGSSVGSAGGSVLEAILFQLRERL